jgi:uncharacterized membrane protein
MLRSLWGPLWLTALSVGHAVWRAGELPDPMPVHWGADGVANGWASKQVGLATGPILTLVVPWIVVVAARLDPIGRLDARAPRKLAAMTTAIAAFGFVVSALVLEVARRPEPHLEGRWILIAVGALFASLAWTLDGLPRNGIAGVRTPWSLASDANWRETHRVAVPAMAAGGGVTVAAAIALPEPVALGVGLAALVGSVLVGLIPGLRAWLAGRR